LAHEQDFPEGHPKRFDYDPASPAAKEWAREHVFTRGEPAYPRSHPTYGGEKNARNLISWQAGVDPFNPHLEAFTGRTPEHAEAVRAHEAELSRQAQESPAREPIIAPSPEDVQRAIDIVKGSGYDQSEAEQIVARQGVANIIAGAARE
jgi:hypothetical protein